MGLAIAMSVWRAREAKTITTYGSARWATKRDIREAELLYPDGVILGRLGRNYLRHRGPEHVLCFAATRSGKGVGPKTLMPAAIILLMLDGRAAAESRDAMQSTALRARSPRAQSRTRR